MPSISSYITFEIEVYNRDTAFIIMYNYETLAHLYFKLQKIIFPETIVVVEKILLENEFSDCHNIFDYEDRPVLHLCTFQTPPSGAVMSERGDADCAFQMHNGVKQIMDKFNNYEKMQTQFTWYNKYYIHEIFTFDRNSNTLSIIPQDSNINIFDYINDNPHLFRSTSSPLFQLCASDDEMLAHRNRLWDLQRLFTCFQRKPECKPNSAIVGNPDVITNCFM